ncbi:MAG: HAMP domain-containing sensor histidine kinase [Patescibacteria group bacterium]
MINPFSRFVGRGAAFVRDNPQIVYTLFLVIVIPLAFLWTAEKFLQVSARNQERLEEDRIGTMHDVFVGFVRNHMDDTEFLNTRITEFSRQNESFIETRVTRYPDHTIIASNNAREVGSIDDRYTGYYELAGAQSETLVFEELQNSIRHRPAFRAIVDTNGQVLGHLMTNTSMEHIDILSAQNIRRAYLLLVAIIVALILLLARHARIVDYTVLYRRLKELDQMKDDFISIASHELRTPVTALRWQIDLFTDPNNNGAVTKESLQTSIDQLNRLIEDILDVSRIEQGRTKFEIHENEITTLIEQTVTSLGASAKQKNLTLTYDKPEKIRAMVDPDRFRQVITNIVGNSIKYTLAGSVIVTVAQEGSKVVIRVRDTGIGISADEQQNLFQKFYRVKSAETRSVGGTGLGLWITKQIVETMDGRIALESMKGVGSTFIVSFPLAKKS